ncbi:hypothetical protein ACFE04_004246 [Oxalis oulophora]
MYINDNSKLLEVVQAEQNAIFEINEDDKQPLTWSQTRKMPLTHKVLLESLRMASVISFTFREAVADVEYEDEEARNVDAALQADNVLALYSVGGASKINWTCVCVADGPKVAADHPNSTCFKACDARLVLV